MGVNNVTASALKPYLPARILSLGWPDHLIGNVDLTRSVVECVDIIAHHGSERIADLSVLQNLGQYDVVLDCGTLEHCANVTNAFINAANAVRVGGHIIHHLPLNMLNHGYWNISPVWYADFYRHNRFKLERLEMTVNGSFHDCKIVAWPVQRILEEVFVVPYQALTLCVATRVISDTVRAPMCQEMWKNK